MDEGADAAKAYRKRAAELRVRAEDMTDADNRRIMLSVARLYEQLAKAVEFIARGPKILN
jgi:hypothetical protein